MSKLSLVILAAGIGSRFGGGIKQLTPIDETGHLIIDYSIHDAIAAGFQKIIFIIRQDIEEDFRLAIGNRIEAICLPYGVEVAYAFQDMKCIPDILGKERLVGRTKPWGTGHAVLSCEGLIDGPFSVINADDYYGKKGFKKAAAFLKTNPEDYALIGYRLKNTLSDHGGVTRGVCRVEDGRLTGIDETRNIVKTGRGAEAEGKELNVDSLVSMNFWCYPLAFMEKLKTYFPFFLTNMVDPMKEEFLLPVIADKMLKEGTVFSVLPTDDRWFGVTYKEDRPAVANAFKQLIEAGEYEADLYSDL